ncbi:hypothetical protein [Burkholderia sp. MSMB1826]|uniref:hypothetical protein n=1 Tax=Burkholderia sp. MSMB1826 TaxID=1637875 RepID=UPI000B2109D8|nr:hypothetical protein [Burkholderia sp. MSMB1826]
MSIQRIGSSYTQPDLSQETEALQQQDSPISLHHRHHALARQKRPSLRKRRNAESPDANDPAAESEELLMMLDQHLRRDQTGSLKVDTRDSRGSQHGFEQDEHSASGQADGNLPSPDIQQNLPVSALPMHLEPRNARDESVLLRDWNAAASGKLDGSSQSPTELAETAFLVALTPRTRRAASAAASQVSRTTGQTSVGPSSHILSHINTSKSADDESTRDQTTYRVLAIMREFMRMPTDARKSHTTLAQIRDRLVNATIAVRSAPGSGLRPLSPAEESMNLLLPIALLNLGRSRTRAGRAMGMSALAALIRHGRGW